MIESIIYDYLINDTDLTTALGSTAILYGNIPKDTKEGLSYLTITEAVQDLSGCVYTQPIQFNLLTATKAKNVAVREAFRDAIDRMDNIQSENLEDATYRILWAKTVGGSESLLEEDNQISTFYTIEVEFRFIKK